MAGIAGGIVEYFSPADRFTAQVDEASGVDGGNVLTITATGRQVGLCGASDRPIGVALHDAADNEMVTVVTEGVWPLKAAGAITAGDIVVCASGGAVAADNTTTDAPYFIVGIALESIGDTATGPVKLRL